MMGVEAWRLGEIRRNTAKYDKSVSVVWDLGWRYMKLI